MKADKRKPRATKRPKSAPGKYGKGRRKAQEFAIPQTDRKLKKSTSRYKGYTAFSSAEKVQNEFRQQLSRGAFLSYNATIRSVQNYSKEVGVQIDRQLRSMPPKDTIDSKSQREYAALKKQLLASYPQQPKRAKAKETKQTHGNLFRMSAFEAHNSRVKDRLKLYYENGVAESIRHADKEKMKAEKTEHKVQSIKSQAIQNAIKQAKQHKKDVQQAKKDVDFQVRKEMTAAIEYEREWMKDELETKAREHEHELKELRQLIKELNEDLLSEKAQVVQTRTDFEQQICKINAVHVVEMSEAQQLNKKERVRTRDAMMALSTLVAQSTSETACSNMVAKEHKTSMEEMRQKLQKTIENSNYSTRDLMAKLESQEQRAQQDHVDAEENYHKLKDQKDEEIEQLERRHKSDIKNVISSSAQREANAVNRAVHNAQKDLSKILIANAEKIKSRLVLRHKTIVGQLEGKISGLEHMLLEEKDHRQREESELVVSSMVQMLLSNTYVQTEKNVIAQRHNDHILVKEKEIATLQERITAFEKNLQREQASKVKLEEDFKELIVATERNHAQEVREHKEEYRFDKMATLERAKDQRENIIARMTRQRKELEEKHSQQKQEILAAFRSALEATAGGPMESSTLGGPGTGSVDDQIVILTQQLTNRHAREKASIAIQKLVRGFAARKACRSLRRQVEDDILRDLVHEYSATKIQSTWRKYKTFQLYKNLKWVSAKHKRNQACRQIGRSWRCYQTRVAEARRLAEATLKPPKPIVSPKVNSLRFQAQKLQNAVLNNDFDYIARCISLDPTVIHRRDDMSGMSALHIANTRKMASLLKDAGADLNCRDVEGRTPLIFSISENKKLSYIRWLISNGANVTLLSANTEFCGPQAGALHVAASLGKIEETQMIISAGADTNSRDGSGWTPLFYAVARSLPSNVDVVKTLIDGHARVNITDSEGVTPLLLSVMQKTEDCAHQLLHARADPNAFSSQHGSPIFQCVMRGLTNTLRQILAYGGFPDGRYTDEDGSTALHIAARMNRLECLEMILEANPGAGTKVDGKGNSPLHDAIYHKRTRVVMSLLRFQNNLLHRNKEGVTPLDLAERMGHRTISQLLRSSPLAYELEEKHSLSSLSGSGADYEDESDSDKSDDSIANISGSEGKHENENTRLVEVMAAEDPEVPYYDDPSIEFWGRHFDESSNRAYWYNSETGESTWNMPLALQELNERNLSMDKARSALSTPSSSRPREAVEEVKSIEDVDQLFDTDSVKEEEEHHRHFQEDWNTYRI
eukprot:g3559.t1